MLSRVLPAEPLSLGFLLSDFAAADALLQRLRWPNGKPSCPHCGAHQHYRLTCARTGGVRYKCAACRKQYSARRGTVMERSNVPNGRWMVALALATGTPKSGLPARIERLTGVSYKTAWTMVRRMKDNPDDPLLTAMARLVEQGAIDFTVIDRHQPETIRTVPRSRATLLSMAALSA